MSARLPPNVHTEVTRHGRRIYYFRADRGVRVRLPEPRTAGFAEALKAARVGAPVKVQPRPVRPTFVMIKRQKVGDTLTRAVSSARQRAKAKGVPFSLNVQWALDQAARQNFKCALTGIPFFMDFAGKSKVNPYIPSIDRSEPAKGYTPDNARLVIFAVNLMLFDWGQPIFERVMNGYRYTKGTKSRTSIPSKGKEVRASDKIIQQKQ